MPTPLSRPVVRVARSQGKPSLVVTLVPEVPGTGVGPLLEIREAGRRSSSAVAMPLHSVYYIAVQRAVDSRKAKRNPRRTSLLTGRAR